MLTVEAKKRSLVITFQNLVGTCQAMFFSFCYRQLFITKMTEQEKTIAKIFDKSIEAFGIMTKSLCDAIKSTKQEKRYVMYQDQKCELLGTTDGSITLNTGGLAFCIIFPDGNIKNVQDTQCRFL